MSCDVVQPLRAHQTLNIFYSKIFYMHSSVGSLTLCSGVSPATQGLATIRLKLKTTLACSLSDEKLPSQPQRILEGHSHDTARIQ